MSPDYTWLQVRTPAQILREVPAEREWLVEHLLPMGSFLLWASNGKGGKSTFLWPMLAAIFRAVDFLGWTARKARVLVLTEEPEDIVRDRLAALNLDVDSPDFLVHNLPKDITVAALADFEKWINHDTRPCLLVIDTGARYAGIRDSNNTDEVRVKLNPLLVLVRKYARLVLLYIHHERKNGDGADDGMTVLGSEAFVSTADHVFVLSKVGPGTQRRFTTLGRYRDIPPTFVVEWDGDVGYRLVSAELHVSAVRAFWDSSGAGGFTELTANELAVRFKVKPSWMAEILNRERRNPHPHVTWRGTGAKGDPYRYSSARHSSADPSSRDNNIPEESSNPVESKPENSSGNPPSHRESDRRNPGEADGAERERHAVAGARWQARLNGLEGGPGVPLEVAHSSPPTPARATCEEE